MPGHADAADGFQGPVKIAFQIDLCRVGHGARPVWLERASALSRETSLE